MLIEHTCIEVMFVYYAIFSQAVMLCSMTVDFRIRGEECGDLVAMP